MNGGQQQVQDPGIFFIDDQAMNPRASAPDYLKALNEARMSVHLGLSVADAICHIEENKEPEDAVILDVMMDDDATIDGHTYAADDAGIGILRRRLRNPKYAYNHVPVLILTNRNTNDKIIMSATKLPRVHVVAKQKLDPGDLPALVRGII